MNLLPSYLQVIKDDLLTLRENDSQMYHYLQN